MASVAHSVFVRDAEVSEQDVESGIAFVKKVVVSAIQIEPDALELFRPRITHDMNGAV
jgi:hypothetical protein